MSVKRNEFTNLMQQDMYGYYLERYNTFNPVYPQIFDVRPSSSAFEKSTTAIGMGKLSRRPEGQAIPFSNPLEGYTVLISARTYSDGLALSMEFQEDTPKEKMADAIRGIARSWADTVISTKESIAASIFNYGGYTSGHEIFNNTVAGEVDPSGNFIYDGKPFFALSGNNHPAKAHSTTYYNSLALALSSDNLQTAYTLMTSTNNRNERGEIIQLMPDTLLIPPALKFTASSILESNALITGASATLGNKNVVQGLVTPVVWQYLTDTDAWFLGAKQKGIVFYERKEPVVDFYQDEETKAYKATVDLRFGVGVENWRYWVGSQLSTS